MSSIQLGPDWQGGEKRGIQGIQFKEAPVGAWRWAPP